MFGNYPVKREPGIRPWKVVALGDGQKWTSSQNDKGRWLTDCLPISFDLFRYRDRNKAGVAGLIRMGHKIVRACTW
jgi:hypothetical protein